MKVASAVATVIVISIVANEILTLAVLALVGAAGAFKLMEIAQTEGRDREVY